MDRTARFSMIAAFAGSAVLSAVMAATRRDHGLGLGPAWAWILTALQVTALYAVGRGHGVGWLLGAAVQLCWITYAVLTTQYGFVPGCVVSALVQGYSYLRTVRRPPAGVGARPAPELAEEASGTERGG
ncbi:hypothetical protein [Plantactinospora sonchi]|uniref:DUF4233 domain-containing protein n=1 Tax=Plantactinospora sonchi TaxID=1544735 RepID=A0ABU7RTE0_9ACTN